MYKNKILKICLVIFIFLVSYNNLLSSDNNFNTNQKNLQNNIEARILSINDFHGQIMEGLIVSGRPAGSAAVLAAYLRQALSKNPESTIIVHVGDHIGGSIPESALLQDEPSIEFFNMLTNSFCTYASRYDEYCNVLATVGNHEFDEGQDELNRIIFGGNHKKGPFLENPYQGAKFGYISSNIIKEDGETILKPYAIKIVSGVKIGFIGAILKNMETMVSASGIKGLKFLDEADSINKYVMELKKEGIKAIVVLIHQGGQQDKDGTFSGPIFNIVKSLNSEVDIVLSGHSHTHINTLVKNRQNKDILLTQAYSNGTAYADIQIMLDRISGDIVKKEASIVTTFADEGAGLKPEQDIKDLTLAAANKTAPIVNEIIGSTKVDITRTQNNAGESALGDLITDAQRQTMKTDFSFMNPGGIRADIKAGNITYGALYSVQPFGNNLIKMYLTGDQIYTLLTQQWTDESYPRMLQISGLTYLWDSTLPLTKRVIEIQNIDGSPIDRAKTYAVTVNSFLADGGDNFTILKEGKNREIGAVDLDALINYIRKQSLDSYYIIQNRIKRID